MPRQTEDYPIRTKTQRTKLKPRRAPYYRRLSDRLNIGYRRLSTMPGTWIIRERLPNGKYAEHKLDGATPDDVVGANGVDILSFDQASAAARDSLSPAVEQVTLHRAADEWAEWKISETDSAKRAQNYRNSATRHVGKFPDGIQIASISAKQVQAFRDDFLIGIDDPDAKRARRATANKQLAELKAILNRACDHHGLTVTRPWDAVKKFPKAESFGKRIIVLTEPDITALLEACDSPALRDLVRAGLMTGCRYGELIGARRADLKGLRLTVTGKTGRRAIVIPEAALDVLTGSDHLLVSPDGNPWREDQQLAPMAAAVSRAGLDPAVTFYACRHTYITQHLSRGVPVTALAHQCGTSVEMIEKSYAHFLGNDLDRWFGFPLV